MKVIQVKTKGSNTFIIKDKKSIIVDTGKEGNANKILKALEDASITRKNVSLIVITHAHIDHYGSLRELKKYLKCPVLIHQHDAIDMEKGTISSLKARNAFGKLILPFLNRKTKEIYKAELKINGSISLTPYGVRGEIILTPGHTDGSLSILLEDGNAIIGDLLMGGSLGGLIKKSQPRLHYFFNNKESEKDSIEYLKQRKPITIHVGHGGPFSMKRLIKSNFDETH